MATTTPMVYDRLFPPDVADRAFVTLQATLNWTRYGTVPREEYYVNWAGPYPYTYGRGDFARTYQPQPSHGIIDEIRGLVERRLSTVLDVCFLNRYLNQSDHLGWHSDNSPEMDDARPVVTVSLGAEREIWFRKIPEPSSSIVVNGNDQELLGFPPLEPKVQKQLLAHGSICAMPPGMQDTHQHRIPKASRICGERISLTFRGYVPIPSTST